MLAADNWEGQVWYLSQTLFPSNMTRLYPFVAWSEDVEVPPYRSSGRSKGATWRSAMTSTSGSCECCVETEAVHWSFGAGQGPWRPGVNIDNGLSKKTTIDNGGWSIVNYVLGKHGETLSTRSYWTHYELPIGRNTLGSEWGSQHLTYNCDNFPASIWVYAGFHKFRYKSKWLEKNPSSRFASKWWIGTGKLKCRWGKWRQPWYGIWPQIVRQTLTCGNTWI